ncbi:MAG: ABC transporter substrate-binding protein, partial [Planctomycetota bacterium]
MESGKLGTLSFLGVMVVVVFSVLLFWQQDGIERRLDTSNNFSKSISKDNEALRKDFDSLQMLEGLLGDMKKSMGKEEENAKKIERLAGQVDELSKQVQSLSRTKVVQVPVYAGGAPPRGGAPDLPGEKEETDEQPSFGEEEGVGEVKPPGKKETPGETEVKKAEPARELTEFDKWKATLMGRKLKKGEIDRLWKKDEKGIIRPVIPMDISDYDPARDGGTIRRRLGQDPKGFNPLTENSADVSDMEYYCIPWLCKRRLADPNVWEYELATDVEISDDFKVYTFKIRKGVNWQLPAVNLDDPKRSWLRGVDREVTAHDFKFKMDMIKNPQVQCEHSRQSFEEFERSEVVDRYTFRMIWKKKTYNSLSASLGLAPLARFLFAFDEKGDAFPKETLGKDFNEHWYNNMILGCGAYNFVEWRGGQFIQLEKNPEYFGRQPNIDTIMFMIMRDDEAAFTKIQSMKEDDRLDFIHITRAQFKKFYREPKLVDETPMFHMQDEPAKEGQNWTVHPYTRLGYSYIGWNLENELFKDKRVRAAMTHAFPRQLILDTIFLGLGDVVSGNFYLHGPDYNHDVKPHPFDLDEAARLLREAGWDDPEGTGVLEKEIKGEIREFRFRLYIWANSEAIQNMANIFKEELRKVGVIVDVSPLEWSIFQQKMEGREFDAFTGAWALDWVSDPNQIWHSKMADTPKSSNFVSFRNKECDEIIEKARETFDPIARSKLFNRFHEI